MKYAILPFVAFLLVGCASNQVPILETQISELEMQADQQNYQINKLRSDLVESRDYVNEIEYLYAEATYQLEEREIQAVKIIYFDFDSYELDGVDTEQILFNRGLFDDFINWHITVEGYCDERGRKEYNFLLGQYRAKSVFDFLEQSGMDMTRVAVKSFGELNAKSWGHNEHSWQQNRRVEFKISQ